MTRICLVITGLSTGGAEMMLLKLLQSMDRVRFTPEVVSLSTLGEIGPRLQAMGIPVLALGMRPGRPDARRFWALVRHLRKSAPDVVHTWMYHADLLGGAGRAPVRCEGRGLGHTPEQSGPRIQQAQHLGRGEGVCLALALGTPPHFHLF